ncbi:MAG: carbohydrate binding family 9 domain-containing protein [Gemmatimonadaceae bacterium]|nr:carbohydrate binding family 9 domain-containing protein [Gemmatimonadaceae bacterium]
MSSHHSRARARALRLLVLIAFPAITRAQTPAARGDDPPAPVAPAVIARDTAGRATVRAIKLPAPLTLDGVLDEAVYTSELPFDGLIQVVPAYGAPASERSDIWVMYDTEHMYVTCRCWDAAPPEQWVVNELRRDTGGLRNNEHFGVLFDTFHDRRSGFAFYTNPLGARADYSIIDEGGSNTDWNPVWTSRTGRFEGGWIVEMAIPLKSLRFRAGRDQQWGIQIRRSIRHKNEWTYLTRVPQLLAGPQALNRVSAGGTLVGLDLPEAGKNLELKPYTLARVATDRVRTPAENDVLSTAVGGDLKYGLTPNLTADLTVNTDFAQVEIDEQQVNLTRFSLFFPEKREFFLEGRGIFDFARGGTGATGSTASSDVPTMFYTRRIGLNNGGVIPIDVGGRLTGKLGPYAVGLVQIGTAENTRATTPPTNFTVLRLKRDILRRSSVGVMATNRSVATSGIGSSAAFGVDGAFLISQTLTANAYWARTRLSGAAPGTGTDDASYQARLDYSADRYGAVAEHLAVGADFDPQIGFRRRADIRRSYGQLRFSPRPTARFKGVRKFTWTTSGEYIENGAGTVETRIWLGHFDTEFQSSDKFAIDVTRDYEFLRQPFTPTGSTVAILPGGYDFSDIAVSYEFGAQRRAAGTVRLQGGQYYDGTISSITIGPSNSFSSARIAILKQLAVEPTFAVVRIERPTAAFTTRLARARIDYGFTPLMFASALLQYSSADRAFSTNLRFRWEYAPGSEIFLVYTDERDMTADRFVTPTTVRGLKNRAFIIKVNRLFRY